LHVLQRGAHGRAARTIIAVEFLAFGIPDQNENVPAESVARGLDQAEHGVGGNGGIDCGAALFQNVDRDLCGERMGRGGSTIRGDHDGARGEGLVRHDAVARAVSSRKVRIIGLLRTGERCEREGKAEGGGDQLFHVVLPGVLLSLLPLAGGALR
jgi:hypothetical protein